MVSVAPAGTRWLMASTSTETPRVSESRMNSCRLVGHGLAGPGQVVDRKLPFLLESVRPRGQTRADVARGLAMICLRRGFGCARNALTTSLRNLLFAEIAHIGLRSGRQKSTRRYQLGLAVGMSYCRDRGCMLPSGFCSTQFAVRICGGLAERPGSGPDAKIKNSVPFSRGL